MRWNCALIGAVVLLSFNSRLVSLVHAAEDSCEAPDEWFVAGGTPRVPDNFAVPSNEECNFYKWAWQSFLWLTQSDEIDGQPRFIGFKPPNELFPMGGPASHPLIATARSDTDKKTLLLSVRTSPMTSREVSAMAFAQASSQGVLVDQNHRPVFYGQHLNPAFEKFVKGKKEDGGLHLLKPSDIKDVDPTAQFPPGCLELKSAWRVLTEQEKSNLDQMRERFFITDALVPVLVQVTDGSGHTIIHADPAQKPRIEKVALVSLHVVGTIQNHPEFIWSSFEHVDNAPVLAKQNTPSDQPISQETRFTFYRAGTKFRDCNQNPVSSTTAHLVLTDPDKQTLDPVVDVFRQYNSGDDLESVDSEVDSLNKSVASKLTGKLNVWKNYRLIGAVWIDDPATNFAEGLIFGDSVLAGEKRLSNTAVETFTQASKPNCFSCHTTISETENGKSIPDLRVKISHILRNAYIYGQ